MPGTTHLEAVAQGVATAEEARRAIAAYLEQADEARVTAVCTALRAWVWKALDGRRRDPELREWYRLLERVEGRLALRYCEHAARIQVLYELISESIAVAETVSAEQALERNHVRSILALLRRSPGGEMGRAAIGASLGLKQGNLTRVLNLMCLAALIERHPRGKEAIFRMTRQGQAEAERLPASDAVRGKTPSPDVKAFRRQLTTIVLEMKTPTSANPDWGFAMLDGAGDQKADAKMKMMHKTVWALTLHAHK